MGSVQPAPCPAHEPPVQLRNWKLALGVALSVTVSPTLALQLEALLQRAFASLTVAPPLPLFAALIVTQPARQTSAACASGVGVATGGAIDETRLTEDKAELAPSAPLGGLTRWAALEDATVCGRARTCGPDRPGPTV